MPGRFRHPDEWGTPSRPGRSSMRGVWLLFIAAIMYVVGAVSGGPMWVKWSQNHASLSPTSTRPLGVQGLGTAAGNIITRVYRSVSPSIFTITAFSKGTSHTGPQEDVGTGFLIDGDGDIATNNHVVNGLQTVTVTVGNVMVTGKVIGTDSIDDLAIVKIPPPTGVQPLMLGNSSGLQPGTPVIAIGNPFQMTQTVTSGIISGLNRSIPSSSGLEMTGLLQTDASLNPGNSGGPLLDDAGRVIGINTAIESPIQGSVGIGFAIPINKLKSVLRHLLAGQPVQHPWIGIVGLSIDPFVRQEYHLPVMPGILVVAVDKGGPAQLAGIHPDSGGISNPKGDGDIILAVDGKPVATVANLTSDIAGDPVGTTIQLTVLRHGKRIKVNLQLQSWHS